MDKRSNIIRIMCEVGLFSAIGFILDELQGAWSVSFYAGGSIGIAMLAVLIMAYRRGFLPALFTGLIMGCLDLVSKAYIYHPAQVFLDYIFPYALVAVAGFLKPFFDKSKNKTEAICWLISGAVVGGMLKFLSHYLSGVIFFSDPSGFVWGLNDLHPAIYSLVYNIAFIGPSIILSGGFLVLLYLRAPQLLKLETREEEPQPKDEKPVYAWFTSMLFISGGTFGFVWCLVKWIVSIEIKEKSGYVKFSTNQDCVVICVLSATLVIAGVFAFIRLIRKRNTDGVLATIFPIVTGVATIYAVAKIIAIAVDGGAFSDYRYYIYWMITTFLLCVLGVIGLANHLRLKKGEEI